MSNSEGAPMVIAPAVKVRTGVPRWLYSRNLRLSPKHPVYPAWASQAGSSASFFPAAFALPRERVRSHDNLNCAGGAERLAGDAGNPASPVLVLGLPAPSPSASQSSQSCRL